MEQNIKDQEKSADENGLVCNGRLISLIIRGNYIYIYWKLPSLIIVVVYDLVLFLLFYCWAYIMDLFQSITIQVPQHHDRSVLRFALEI